MGRIDLQLAAPPPAQDELSWTCEFCVTLVARRWLSAFEDLVDNRNTFVGEVWVGSQPSQDWATLNAIRPPPLSSDDERSTPCPTCGSLHKILWGKTFFSDPTAIDLPLIVNQHGIFIREDEFTGRNIPAPRGAFRPSWVSFRQNA